MESCIRNVINILLFDIEAQKFDVSRLEVLRPYQPLLQFYKGEGRFVGLGPQSGGLALPTFVQYQTFSS